MTQTNLDMLYRLLKRIDEQMQLLNVKASLLLPFNLLLLGLSNQLKPERAWAIAAFVASFAFVAVSIFFASRTLFAFLKSGGLPGEYESLLFFGSIARMSPDSFLEKFRKSSHADFERDLTMQIHILARNLTARYRDFNIALTLSSLALLLCSCLAISAAFS